MKEINKFFEDIKGLEPKNQKILARKFYKDLYSAYKKNKITLNEMFKNILKVEEYPIGNMVPVLQVILLTKEIKAKEFEIGGTKEEKLEKLELLINNL